MIQTKEIFACDWCNVEREKDSKHWWILGHNNSGSVPWLWAEPWNERDKRESTVQHLCSFTCLYQAINKVACNILKAASAVKA